MGLSFYGFSLYERALKRFPRLIKEKDPRVQAQASPRWALAHARFKGALRRLAVPDQAEYDEEEYTEAIEAFFSATKAFSAHSRSVLSLHTKGGTTGSHASSYGTPQHSYGTSGII
jgi:hypothetical protein